MLIQEMEERFLDAINDLKKTEEKTSAKNRWTLGIALSLMTALAGAFGTRLLDRVENLSTSVTRLEVQMTTTARLTAKVDALEHLVHQIDKRTDDN